MSNLYQEIVTKNGCITAYEPPISNSNKNKGEILKTCSNNKLVRSKQRGVDLFLVEMSLKKSLIQCGEVRGGHLSDIGLHVCVGKPLQKVMKGHIQPGPNQSFQCRDHTAGQPDQNVHRRSSYQRCRASRSSVTRSNIPSGFGLDSLAARTVIRQPNRHFEISALRCLHILYPDSTIGHMLFYLLCMFWIQDFAGLLVLDFYQELQVLMIVS